MIFDVNKKAILIPEGRKNIPGGEISEYKGSEAGACPAGLKNSVLCCSVLLGCINSFHSTPRVLLLSSLFC